ncbi:hypothetical protein TrRE_jg9685, partial [Triparma retinervis]
KEALDKGVGRDVVGGIWEEMKRVKGGDWGPGGIERIAGMVQGTKDKAMVTFVATLLQGGGEVKDEVYEGAVETMGIKKVVEAVGIVGYYTYVAMTLKCFRVKPEVSNLDDLGLL